MSDLLRNDIGNNLRIDRARLEEDCPEFSLPRYCCVGGRGREMNREQKADEETPVLLFIFYYHSW